MGGPSSIRILSFVILAMTFHTDKLSSAQSVRKKRQILAQQPRIITNDGHLIFQTGANHNISFRTDGGAILVNGQNVNDFPQMITTTQNNMLTVMGLANSNRATLGRYNQRIQRINSRMGLLNSIPEIQGQVSTMNTRVARIESQNRNTTNRSAQRMRRRIRQNRRRIQTLQQTVETLQTLLTTNECASNPCQNGGTCVDMYNGFMCRCPRQWQGPDCTQDVNECSVYAGTGLGCRNGATCVNTHGGYNCQCPPNFYGIHCMLRQDTCSSGSNYEICGHGTCVSSGQTHTCICDEGWTNADSNSPCVIDINECNGNRHCSADPPVQCINLPGDFACGSCPAGYEGNGFTCSDINECQSNNGGCAQGVDCINTRGSYRCGPCPAGYQGDGRYCFFVGSCDTNNGGCHPQATCLDQVGGSGRICSCPVNYVGNGVGPNGCVLASQAAGCNSNPCQNGATCHPHGYSDFRCLCATGFTGPTCSRSTDPCGSNPCQNGGTCVANSQIDLGFICNCPVDYSGSLCDDAQAVCGGTLSGPSGSLQYPSGPLPYAHFLSCAWVITVPSDKVIQLTFTSMDIEIHPNCEYDFLQIHDGRSASSYMIGKYCGTELPNGGSINSTRNQIYFWFFSDHSINGQGFQLSWTSIEPECGGELSGADHGQINSPGYPGDYPHNRDCVWTVAVDPGSSIIFTFAHLALEEHHNCSYDFLEIRDGETDASPLLNRYCSSVNPPPLQTTGPFAYLRFHSDPSLADRGFHITYLATSEGRQGCGGSLTGNEGTVMSPGYPGAYQNDAQCVWVITGDEGTQITLTFNDFDLETSSSCIYDSLTIRDGSDQNAPLLATHCGNDTPSPVTGSSNVLFIELRTDESLTGTGFSAQWHAGCGGHFIGMTGMIQSPGWPNSYPHNQECDYFITAPELHTVQVNITDFGLEHDPSCSYDSLLFYDGPNTNSQLIPPQLCGNLDQRIMRSTGQSMTVKFLSDESISDQGFRATYVAVAAPPCGEVLNADSGLISRYPWDGDRVAGTVCEWVMTVSPGSVVKLRVNGLLFPRRADDLTCGNYGLEINDYIPVGDGYRQQSLGTWCNNERPVVTSSSNRLSVNYTIVNGTGPQFLIASFSAINSTSCGENLTDSSGVITSPNFPNNYPHNVHCVWRITVPAGHQIRLNITDFEVESSFSRTDCYYDFLEVRHGSNFQAPLHRRYCGAIASGTIIYSHSNQIYLRLVTDGSMMGSGFRIEYTSGATGCGGELTTQSGGFVSPNYPQHYPHSTTCYWTITVSQGSAISLVFDSFDLEHSYGCNYDSVIVRDGSNTAPILGSPLCGNNVPPMIMSTNNQLSIAYRTDSSDSGTGFSARYQAVCNRNITGYSGVIESPNFPNAYHSRANCTWIITVPQGNKVNISFAALHMEQSRHSSSCIFDALTIRDGNSPTSTLIGEYCGTTLPDMIHSSGNSVWLQFISDDSFGFQGFRLEWVMDGCGGRLTESNGTFTSPNYPNRYGNQVQCTWTIEVPQYQKIKLTITDFDLEFHQDCGFDSLAVFPGPIEEGPAMTTLCHAQTSPQVITSSGNKLVVRFRTDAAVTGNGFSATYEAITGGCGGNFTIPTATFTSPNFPSGYPTNADCEWYITVAEGYVVELNFTSFDVEGDYDYVYLYDGNSTSAPQIAQLTGGESSATSQLYRSNTNMMVVRLRTDSSIAHAGFNVTYTTGCGGALDADAGGIISYTNLVWGRKICIWHIASNIPAGRPSLTFTRFNMHDYCDRSSVSITDSLELQMPASDEETQNSYCGSSLPPTYHSRSSAITVVFNSTIPQAGFTAAYSSAEDACGGVFDALSGSFTSPLYPDSYPADIECVWQINTAPGNAFRLTLSQPNFGYGGFNDDYLEIRTPDVRGRLVGRWFGGNTLANRTQLFQEGAWIKFRSNDDVVRGTGFTASWNDAFGAALTGNTGTLGSPGETYTNNVDYRWTITVPEGFVVRLTFSRFEMEGNAPACLYDRLEIHDGTWTSGISMGRFCGTALPDPLTSVNNIVSLWFHTDISLTFRGFLLTWEAIPEHMVPTTPAPTTATARASSSGCGGALFAGVEAQNLTSPNHPGRYSNRANCVWTITAGEGRTVDIDIVFLEMEMCGSRCYCDRLVIYDGGSTSSQIIGRHCGNNAPGKITSTASTVTIEFRTDYSVQRDGFRLLYSRGCGGDLQGSGGVVQSPLFPENYPTGKTCTWKLSVPIGRTIQVDFDDRFNILGGGPGSNCTADYLQLYNGGDMFAPPLGNVENNGRYCGSAKPTVPETGSNLMIAKFVSDDADTGIGFSFNFTEVEFACGGQLSLMNGVTEGYFKSPNYPGEAPQNVECNWVIVAPANTRIQVDFVDQFDIEEHDQCQYDYVMFRDGGTQHSPMIGDRLCGTHLPGTIKSTGNILYAGFRTDSSLSGIGFRAKYTVASCGGRIVATEGVLTSPDFPQRYPDNADCFWVIQGPVGHYLTINITSLDIETSLNCSSDVLEIIDPATHPSHNLDLPPMNSSSVTGIEPAQAAQDVESAGGRLYRGCTSYIPSIRSFQTADNRAYIWFKTNGQSTSSSGFQLSFAASVDECGGTLTTDSGEITSPNYPNIYPHRRTCTWKIRVQPGRKITLTFEDLRLERGLRPGVCVWDYVVVRNGDIGRESPFLGRYCGQEVPSEPVSSSGNTMTVIFRSDSDTPHYGFRAVYTSDEEADCGGILTANSGNITSSLNFTADGSSTYGHAQYCVWQIQNRQTPGSIRFRFTYLNIEKHMGCRYDSVQIREGTSYDSPLIGRFCGELSDYPDSHRWTNGGLNSIVLPTSDAWVAFLTDASVSEGGFRLDYEITPCGGVLMDPSGVITSPNYPESYDHEADCAWLIRAPEGTKIKINVTNMAIEMGSTVNHCQFDYLAFYNGGSYNSTLLGVYCGVNTTVPVITSQSNEMRIVFSSDYSIAHEGFRLEYEFVQSGCGGHLSGFSGSFESPNYPSNYPHNTQCEWNIVVDAGYHVELQFTPPFDLEAGTCIYDYVKVYDVHSNGTATLLGTYCQNETPPNLRSSSNKMKVVFRSDVDTNGNGFHANYSAACGGVLEGDDFNIVSPGYPGYQNNMLCTYTLTSEGRSRHSVLFLSFQDLQIESGTGCPHDYLEVELPYMRPIYRPPTQPRKLCGDSVPEPIIGRGSIHLTFKTDGDTTFRGYRATFRAEQCGGNYTDRSGYLSTPANPSGYFDASNCTWFINAPPDMIVTLKFITFDVERHSLCAWDSLSVYDGNSTSSHRIGRFCGTIATIPETVRSSGNQLLLNFVSDHVVQRQGFTAVYTTSYGPSVGCGGNLQQSSGTIQSLDYDGDGSYEDNLHCVWTITVGEGKVVMFNITDMDLEQHPNCLYDFVKVYDGPNTDNSVLLNACQRPDGRIVRSSSRVIQVVFQTDSSGGGRGFNASFWETDSLCGGPILNATTTPQNLTSSDLTMTGSGEQSHRCRWTVDSGANDYQVLLNLQSVQLGSDCATQYILIEDKPKGTHGASIRICFNSTIPQYFYSRKRQASITFHLEQEMTNQAFFISYERAGCSRTYVGTSGRITSPNYPEQYNHNLDCTILVTAPPETFLSFYFSAFHMEGSSSCPFDHFTLTSGNYSSGRLCSNVVPSPIFVSSNNATISVGTDYSVAYAGYDVTFVASTTGVGCGGDLSGAIPGVFTSPQYPAAPTGPLNCTWTINSTSANNIRISLTIQPAPGGSIPGISCPGSYVMVRNLNNQLTSGRICTVDYESYFTTNKIAVQYVVPSNSSGVVFRAQFFHLDQPPYTGPLPYISA